MAFRQGNNIKHTISITKQKGENYHGKTKNDRTDGERQR